MKKLAAFLSLSTILLAGCGTSTGPKAIKAANYPYNDAVFTTYNDQLLLNLVRLRYRDLPCFLEINTINSSYEFSKKASAPLNLKYLSRIMQSATPELSYAEKPTITFVPIQGDKLIKQLSRPIPIDFISNISQAGWSIERVFGLCVQQINNVPNAPSASGPTPDIAPKFDQYLELCKCLRELQKEGLVELVTKDDDAKVIKKTDSNTNEDLNIIKKEKTKGFLHFLSSPDSDPRVKTICQILNISPSSPFIELSWEAIDSRPNTVRLHRRSLVGTMFYLSQNVHIPQEHIDKGLVTITKNPDGSTFDWNQLTGKFITIKSSKSKPQNTSIKIFYRNYWFYIDESDLNSKSTFMFLHALQQIQMGSSSPVIPTLTLSAGV